MRPPEIATTSTPVPPSASSPAVRAVMRANRRRDTGPELRLRRALHAAGLRYRVDLPIRAGQGRPIRPDVTFTRARLAVFLDGCFWHSCPAHGTAPGANSGYWGAKLERNRQRDRKQEQRLDIAGWPVLRAWEHEDVDEVLTRGLEALGRPSC